MCRALLAIVLLVLVTPAAAQPTCADCARGDALIDHFGLQPMRAIAADLVAPLGEPLTTEQYAHVVELRRSTPAAARLGAVGDGDLTLIAEALCRAASGACVDATAHTLRCLADRCTVALPPTDPQRADLVKLPGDCHRFTTHIRPQRYGLGFDFGTGGQRSRYPSDGGVWSLGLEGRMRFNNYVGVVARVDRSNGRDEATDANGDGKDDFSTGQITRVSALAGPSITLGSARFEDTMRFLRLDLLGGYVATRTQADERGPAAGFDLAYQIWTFRFGLRYVQGFGDARDATMLLGHIGFLFGSGPRYDDDTDCGAEVSSTDSRLALGFDIPFTGYGISSQLGYLSSGFGIEGLVHVTRRLDALTRADVLEYPNYNRDRVIHQAVLAGLRIDHMRDTSSETGFFTTLMGGYTHGIGVTPTTAGSGPVVDLSVGWGRQSAEGGASIRLHTRFGVGAENYDYRAVFFSVGLELRVDPRKWHDRAS